LWLSCVEISGMKIHQFNEGKLCAPQKPKTETMSNSSTFCNVECYALLATVNKSNFTKLITFCASRRRRKMYCGHARLCVCLSAAVRPHYCMYQDVTWGRGRGCRLVVHYWADLQSGHGLRCYGNITRTLVTSLHPARDMAT